MKPLLTTLAILLFSCTLHAQRWVQLNPPVNLFNDIIYATVADHNGRIYAGGAFTDSAGEKAVYVLSNGSWTELGTGDSTLHAKGNVYALTTDPSGNIYAGGAFTDASGNYYVAKWNGIYWSPMDPPTSAQNFTGQIFALTSDKSGNIYAAGEMIDSLGNYYVSKFDGMKWQPLGIGSQSLHANGIMYSVIADANGNIYTAGQFTDSSGNWYVAKWNGSNWSELGTGAASLNANGAINSLAVDASGNIYAAGDFKDGSGNQYVAKWDGSSWSELGTGANALAANGMINTILIDTAGHLYAAGMLSNSSDNMVVFQWSGTAWSMVNAAQGVSQFNNYIYSLTSDPTGELFVAGNFTNLRGDHYVARDSANIWTQPGFVGGRMPDQSNAMAAMAVDTRGHVFAVLGTTGSDGIAVVVRWNGNVWVTLPDTTNGGFVSITGLAGDSLGNMYACGTFGASPEVARWNGQGWTVIPTAGSGLTINGISRLATDKNGNVYLAGSFVQNGYLYNLAKWDGSLWTAFANADIIDFIVDPASGAIYANDPDFSNTGYNVLKIVGNTITNIGSSNTQPYQMNATNWMQTLALDANGNLYTGGSLEDSNGNAFVAKWDGANWIELGKDSASFGAVGTINAIKFDGNGNLFAGGNLIKKSQTYIGKWDGSSWSTVGDATQFWEQLDLGFLDRDGQGNIYAEVNGAIYRYGNNQSASAPPPPPAGCYDSAQIHLVVNKNTLNGQNATVEIDAKGMPHNGTTTWWIEFASDRDFTHVLSAPSTDSVLILSAGDLVTGTNTIFAKMQTFDTCNQINFTIDSVTITKTIAGGIVDPDFPNATINTYPNPVSDHVNVTGLSATKSYTIQIYNNQGAQVSQVTVAGQTEANVNFFPQQTGVYMLKVYDNTKNRKIGVMMLLKE